MWRVVVVIVGRVLVVLVVVVLVVGVVVGVGVVVVRVYLQDDSLHDTLFHSVHLAVCGVCNCMCI